MISIGMKPRSIHVLIDYVNLNAQLNEHANLEAQDETYFSLRDRCQAIREVHRLY